MTIRENQTHRIMSGASLQALVPQERRTGLQIANNGANDVRMAWGRAAEANDSCFKIVAGQIYTFDAFVPKSDLHLIGTAGDYVVILEQCRA